MKNPTLTICAKLTKISLTLWSDSDEYDSKNDLDTYYMQLREGTNP